MRQLFVDATAAVLKDLLDALGAVGRCGVGAGRLRGLMIRAAAEVVVACRAVIVGVLAYRGRTGIAPGLGVKGLPAIPPLTLQFDFDVQAHEKVACCAANNIHSIRVVG